MTSGSIVIGSEDSELVFPYGVKYGDSLNDVLAALNITVKFNEALEKLHTEDSRSLELFKNNETNESINLYAKVSSITINNQRAVITYKAYADYDTTAEIDYVVTENNGTQNFNKIYQDITTEEKEYTVTINDCFEKRIDLRIDNIGFEFNQIDYFVFMKFVNILTSDVVKK